MPYLARQPLQEHALDASGLRSQQPDDAEGRPLVARVFVALQQHLDQCLRLGAVDRPGPGALLLPMWDMAAAQRRERVGAELAQRFEPLVLGGVQQPVGELDDLGHAAEVLGESYLAGVADLGLIEQ